MKDTLINTSQVISVDTDSRYLLVMNEVGESAVSVEVWADAHAQVDVVVVGSGDGQVSLSLPVTLRGEWSSADVCVLGLAKSSKISISASMQIAEWAQKTDGQLAMRGLLLDDGAAIAMTPGLNVAANDVSAGHGASIDRVDPGELFYLTSRGLSVSESQKMIRWWMLRDIVQRYDQSLADNEKWLQWVVSSLL